MKNYIEAKKMQRVIILYPNVRYDNKLNQFCEKLRAIIPVLQQYPIPNKIFYEEHVKEQIPLFDIVILPTLPTDYNSEGWAEIETLVKIRAEESKTPVVHIKIQLLTSVTLKRDYMTVDESKKSVLKNIYDGWRKRIN